MILDFGFFLWFLILRFVCTYYKHNLIFTLFALCTLVSRITDQVQLFFIRKSFQYVFLIWDYCLLLKIPCTFIYFLPFLPFCKLISDSWLLGTLDYKRLYANLWKKTVLDIYFFHYILLYVKKKYKKMRFVFNLVALWC